MQSLFDFEIDLELFEETEKFRRRRFVYELRDFCSRITYAIVAIVYFDNFAVVAIVYLDNFAVVGCDIVKSRVHSEKERERIFETDRKMGSGSTSTDVRSIEKTDYSGIKFLFVCVKQ